MMVQCINESAGYYVTKYNQWINCGGASISMFQKQIIKKLINQQPWLTDKEII